MNYRRVCLYDTHLEAIPKIRESIEIRRGSEYVTSEIKRQNLTLFHDGKAYAQVPGHLFAGALPDGVSAL